MKKKKKPIVFALCTIKDKLTYKYLLNFLKDHCDSVKIELSPRYIILDFEKGSHISAKECFENTILKGCYFHLGQIIYRRIQKQVVT